MLKQLKKRRWAMHLSRAIKCRIICMHVKVYLLCYTIFIINSLNFIK